ncbi:2Fe-2S iron-sulfur cluster binding domain-containing protein [Rhizobium sp. VS19-DR104.2]|uniref:xanthine dehydrogenase family Fe-S subunit n=1 Tax=unclassified Rhizobium TaxID=2613769 RepID=UPI001CC35B83|nr:MULTISPECIES: 2Fe-2S iron-sulfur cluster-binding protein [unclassified Rhizobium]MBZ5762225.1 2Fe-2S iron-sulfur cluster binding domain-containing protein [Rhizobium sp. VS19-DR96]MBZ5768241.1 2Fe-2S iron-sulfur cluster binding domain-containing protein [Rhizobium sp. VS19-DR129.2]MBZ5775887.1 2Fe-2S iron-sulfur cluster binding domain-containing protein [Rhizobium sp. VS19-DRK62.2]MBZ5787092.1 2Fe-2S iron-sulfur cluster binding domain-containing protein [Rhizobium sp. VS19-DR121]MBZ5804166.
MTQTVTTRVNGSEISRAIEARLSLGDFLRDCGGLTGTHLGCEHGVCGACTVLLDDKPVRSCIVYAVQAKAREVETVEGFKGDPVMDRLREAFSEHHALQCGFCTSGMLVTARDIVVRLGDVDEKRIRDELAGNLCRCTGYVGIVRAIRQVASEGIVIPPRSSATLATPAAAVVATTAGRTAPSTVADAAGQGAAQAKRGDATVVNQSFTTRHPLADVWAFFADPHAVAACLPGAELEEVDGEDLKGKVHIKMGPIKANFSGLATYKRDDAAKSGAVEGGGMDSVSNSRANGSLTFALTAPDAETTTVTLLLSFTLQGLLAQFSRPALVRDFVGFMVGQFARNLSMALESGGAGEPVKARSLTFWQVATWWLGRLFRSTSDPKGE